MLKRFVLPAFVFCAAVCLLPNAAQAQSATIQKKESGRTATPSVTPVREGIIMRNGKMMTILPKGYAPLTEVKTFPNGAKLQPNGQFTSVDGEQFQLRDGDRLDLKGNLTRNPVTVQQSTTISGDTTGFGDQLIQAQQLQERIALLQRKVAILEKKNEILQSTAKDKSKAAQLQKLDADLAKLKKQFEEEENKKQ